MIENETREIPPEIKVMIENPGLWLGYVDERPNEAVPIWSTGGRLFSMIVDTELHPRRFIQGTKFIGPLNNPQNAKPFTEKSDVRDSGNPEEA